MCNQSECGAHISHTYTHSIIVFLFLFVCSLHCSLIICRYVYRSFSVVLCVVCVVSKSVVVFYGHTNVRIMLAFVAFHLPLASLFDVHTMASSSSIRTLSPCFVVISRISDKQSTRRNEKSNRLIHAKEWWKMRKQISMLSIPFRSILLNPNP